MSTYTIRLTGTPMDGDTPVSLATVSASTVRVAVIRILRHLPHEIEEQLRHGCVLDIRFERPQDER